MPRIRLKALPQYSFATEIGVRVTDVNYGGHLGNDRLLTLLHEARVDFLAHHGWTELDCSGASLIMADAALTYKAEAFAGDVLTIEMAAAEPGRRGFRLFYRVTRRRDNTVIALAETGLVTFDYKERRPSPLPNAVKAVCLAASAIPADADRRDQT